MKKQLLNIIAWCFCLCAYAQPQAASYHGILHTTPLYQEDTLFIELETFRINDTAWEWSMKMGKNVHKNYSLHKSRTDTSQWIMDEHNGILLMGTMSGNQLHFLYSLDSIFYSVIYTFNNENIDFQIHYYDIKKAIPNLSGKYTIMDYPLKGRQYAILRKK